ncbi:MAG TPA: SagB/ThcOx family dehydrogenase [Planctomycetota bacterium]|nr:SagB/ThcOx family dehydrogenase [Planctomycetota bacterium]
MAVTDSYSRHYHDLTKYAIDRLGGGALDWSTQPEPFKTIVTKRKIELSPYLPFATNDFNPKLESGKHDDAAVGEIGPARLSRLLYFTNGVTKIMHMHLGVKVMKFLMRASPSAGGLYPTEIYVAIRNNRHFESGIYNYQVRDHSIIPLWDGDHWKSFERYCFGHAALAESSLTLLFSILPFRSSWRYKERGYRRCLLDTGHVLGNLVAYGHREGFAPALVGGFWDSAFNGHLFFDDNEEVLLAAIAMPLMAGAPPLEPATASAGAATGAAPVQTAVTPKLSAPALRSPPRELPDLASVPVDQISLHLHRLSCIEGPLDPTMAADLVPPAIVPVSAATPAAAAEPVSLESPRDQSAWKHDLGRTILLRRSTRSYSGAPIPKTQLAALLAYGYSHFPAALTASSAVPAADFTAPGIDRGQPGSHGKLFAPEILDSYLIAIQVPGLPSGAYRYDPLGQRALPIKEGDFKRPVHHFCLEQELGRDAAAILIHAADLTRAVERYGERAYRYLHLDSGHIGQRLNLAAIAMNLGASGIGGFFDDEVNDLLNLPKNHIITYITTLGVPA